VPGDGILLIIISMNVSSIVQGVPGIHSVKRRHKVYGLSFVRDFGAKSYPRLLF